MSSVHVDKLARRMQLSTDGIAVVHELLNERECDDVARSLEGLQAVGAGSRRLLHEPWPGSHELGRVQPARAALLGRTNGVTIPAARGDALLMRPLVLHASSKSSGTSRRRVLHFVFGPESLPWGLAW